MYKRKTRRVLVCKLCGHESRVIGTSNRVNQAEGFKAHDEMIQHLKENHSDNIEVQQSMAQENGLLAFFSLWSLEIRRNPQ